MRKIAVSIVTFACVFYISVALLACVGSQSSTTTKGDGVVSQQLVSNYSTEFSASARNEIIMEHVSSAESMPVLFMQFDTSGTCVPYSDIPGSFALEKAALYYAISTLDFAVSLEDIVDNGFWPFDNFPNNIDMNSLIYNSRVSTGLHLNQSGGVTVSEMANTPEWTINARRAILEDYYFDCLYDDSQLKNDSLRKIDKFWHNELSDTPMKESQAFGDYSLWSPYKHLSNVSGSLLPNGRKCQPSDDSLLMDMINYIPVLQNSSSASSSDEENDTQASKEDSSSAINPCARYSAVASDKIVSSNSCCLFREDFQYTTGDGTFDVRYCCPCTPGPPMTYHCCDIHWEVVGGCSYSIWRQVGDCVPCNTQPGSGEVVINGGNNAPPSIWG